MNYLIMTITLVVLGFGSLVTQASEDPYYDIVDVQFEAIDSNDDRYDYLFKNQLSRVDSDCSGQKKMPFQEAPKTNTNKIVTPGGPVVSPRPGTGKPTVPPTTGGNIALNQIVAVGEMLWKIIESNQPVVRTTLPVAHALPRGISCWTDLQQWSHPKVQDYKISYVNAYGMNVIDFVYRVSFTSGGNYENYGAYLSNVSIQAAQLNVSWGFKFEAVVQVGQVVNLGTNDDPLAGMELVINWHASSVIRHMQQTESVFLSGDGILTELTWNQLLNHSYTAPQN